ncbi:MAG: hypothetical protein PVS3B3_18700 [Ktedonobacteraceae bacterium]
MMPRGRRPLGVTIISVLVGIEGLLELIAGILLVLAANSLSHKIVQNGHTTFAKFVDTFGVTIGVVFIIIGVVTLLFVLGLWTLQRWAYWAVIIIEVLTLIPNVIALIRGTGSLAGNIAQMIIPVIVLLYFLVDSNVRRAFRI